MKLTNDIIDGRLKGTKIKRISNCVNGITPITLQCLLNDQHVWDTIPNFSIRKNHVSNCPHCWGKRKLTNDIIDKRLHEKKIKLLT